MDENKECIKCWETKMLEEFGFNQAQWYNKKCKVCIASYKVKTPKEAPYGYKKDWTPRKVPVKWIWKQWYHKKKSGRKLWSKNVDSMKVLGQINSVTRMMATGTEEITDEKNKKMWIERYTPMSMAAACREVGIPQTKVMFHIKKDTQLSKMYKEYREDKQELMKFVSEDNLSKWLNGELELTDKDLVDLSLKVLERTDKAYNPKIEIEQTTKTLNFNVDIKDMERQLQELISI